ncbi:MAG: hypothetical protein ABW019_03405 [Chitinophagaceae bacterium]
MRIHLSFFSLSLLIFLSACHSQSTNSRGTDSDQNNPAQAIPQPNYDYSVEVPENWTLIDTIMEGRLRIRILLPPAPMKTDNPTVNILIAYMEGRNISDYTTANIDYLKTNMPGITILEKGNMDSSIYGGKWFTYTKEQDGLIRELINYIIPFNGFAYQVTCGTNRGSMNKYRVIFDKIAGSFKG